MFDENKRYSCACCCGKPAHVYVFNKDTNEHIALCATCYSNNFKGHKYNVLPIVTKYNNKEKFGVNNVYIGDTIYACDINDNNRKYNIRINEIVISEASIILRGGFERDDVICPLNKLDSNEKWGFCLYFSSDEKRQKYIDNYKETK